MTNLFFIPRYVSFIESPRVIMRSRFPFVIILDFPGSPSTVFFAVIATIVNAIYRSVSLAKLFHMTLIRQVHIIIKVSKGFPKTLYASSSIILKVFKFRIVASLKNVVKNIIKLCSAHSVFNSSLFKSRSSSTATRRSMPIFEVVSNNVKDVSTGTKTFPDRVLGRHAYKFYNNNFIESFTYKVYKSAHTTIITRLAECINIDCGDKLRQLMEVPIKKEWGKMPVEAFVLAGVASIPAARSLTANK